jgi:flagellum-specific ATP synthase
LLARFVAGIEADVLVLALVGERGREVGDFVGRVLGPEGMRRTVVIAATSDRSPMMRRRCALSAMTVAEHFRDAGRNVVLLADSLTRFAEAHREIALSSGEPPSLRGFPPSTAQTLMGLCERAGPGTDAGGDITAIFTVLVAGSDMDEPVADIVRGTLDGHVVLDREIAERGRFPSVDLLRSVSRSLPAAATPKENELIALARRRIADYEKVAIMLRAGLYVPGSDAATDAAIAVWPALDRFLAEESPVGSADCFDRLGLILGAE